ncbi:hypothetical protein, partial [uncultured Dialister sp.]|uniref:hypothetical protein n=1 Tax=uncultured Dialister sp. TaxID=278064 RepID=UPI0027DB236E
KFMEEKGTASLHPLPTPVSGVGGERSEPEGVSCLWQLIYKGGCEEMIYIFAQPFHIRTPHSPIQKGHPWGYPFL